MNGCEGKGNIGNGQTFGGSGGGGSVESVASGSGISVNNTDPANPIVNASSDVLDAASKQHSQNTDLYLDTQASAEIHVDKNRIDTYTATGTPTKPFKTIQEAINYIAAQALVRAIIKVAPGVYTENLTINNDNYITIDLESAHIVGDVTWNISAAVVSFKAKLVFRGHDGRGYYPVSSAYNLNGIQGNITINQANTVSRYIGLHIINTGIVGNITLLGTGNLSHLFFVNGGYTGDIISNETCQAVVYANNAHFSGSASIGGAQGKVNPAALANVELTRPWVIGAPIGGGGGDCRNVIFKAGSIFTGFTGTLKLDAYSYKSYKANVVVGSETITLMDAADGVLNGSPVPGVSVDDALTYLFTDPTQIKNIIDYTETYPTAKEYSPVAVNVATEAALIAAIAAASNYGTINLTADITLTATLVINKPLKFTGAFILQSAGAAGDPVTLINVTGNDVYLTSSLTIKHRKTTNTSVETAVNVARVTGFISEASIEFMEAGYVVRGSCNISGKTTYTGALANNHRHFIIYSLSAASIINNVEYDFPSEATPRDSFVYMSVSGADRWNANLKIANCFQTDMSKIGRQFYLIDSFASDGGASLIVENCRFNELNGDIGFLGASGQAVIDFFDYIAVFNNYSGNAATAADLYKGLVYFDGSGALHDLGSCDFYYSGNIHSGVLRSASDYTSVYDDAGVSYKPSVYAVANFSVKKNTVANSIYNWCAQFIQKMQTIRHLIPSGGSLRIQGKVLLDSLALLVTPATGAIEFFNNKFYITANQKQRVIDRTSDVALETVTVTNTNTETLVYTGLVPANSLIAGNILKMVMSGTVQEATASDNCTIRVKVNGTTMATIVSPGTGVGNQCFDIQGFATIRTIGVTASMAYHIDMHVGSSVSVDCNVTTFDSTGPSDITVTAQWNNAKSGNIFTLNQGFMEYKN